MIVSIASKLTLNLYLSTMDLDRKIIDVTGNVSFIFNINTNLCTIAIAIQAQTHFALLHRATFARKGIFSFSVFAVQT
jgi:hypothetical protein